MCGIAGTFGFGSTDTLRAMTDSIAHRGPDAGHLYEDGPVYLGSRRLAILDPEGGSQPMFNEHNSVVVVYNGEIYNYPELRKDLLSRGHVLQSRCDTEVLPHLYEEEGIDFVRRLNGIFAFALWDRKLRTLFLVRDPLGVKPLVYATSAGQLAFGSEAKAVLVSGLVQSELDELSLHLTMNVRYIPGDRTLFNGIRRVPPGCILQVHADAIRTRRYTVIDWTPDTSLSENDWLEGIRSHLDSAVQRQLLSDVPLGVSLSGGVDSSTVVAMIRRKHSGILNTFTLGFDEPSDETGDARFVANHFGTEHSEIVLHESAMAHLREAIRHTEEPKVNCLQLYLLHRFIGSRVKVVLSGLGGDELFFGYDFYRYLRYLQPVRRSIPGPIANYVIAPVANTTAHLAAALAWPSLDLYVRGVEWVGSMRDGARHYLLLRNAWDFNAALMRRVYAPDFLDRLEGRSRDSFDQYFPADLPVDSEALRAEFHTKLVNDLLHNEDTMAMAHSVESRVPMLDLEFVRFAARIPDELRRRYGLKGFLKKALRPVLPEQVLQKRKWGFTVNPVEQYRKDLRTLALEVLTPERLRQGGIFNPRFVGRILAAQPRERLRWQYFMLWQMIGLEFWRQLFLEEQTYKSTRRGSAEAAGRS